jgi:hypothetical protein
MLFDQVGQPIAEVSVVPVKTLDKKLPATKPHRGCVRRVQANANPVATPIALERLSHPKTVHHHDEGRGIVSSIVHE